MGTHPAVGTLADSRVAPVPPGITPAILHHVVALASHAHQLHRVVDRPVGSLEVHRTAVDPRLVTVETTLHVEGNDKGAVVEEVGDLGVSDVVVAEPLPSRAVLRVGQPLVAHVAAETVRNGVGRACHRPVGRRSVGVVGLVGRTPPDLQVEGVVDDAAQAVAGRGVAGVVDVDALDDMLLREVVLVPVHPLES